MDKRILILVIAIVSALICISPMAAAENNMLAVNALEFNLFGNTNDQPFEIEKMKIIKVKKKHTDKNGNVKKSTKYYLQFNVKTDNDASLDKSYDIKIKCLDKKDKKIKTVKDYIDHTGKYKIALKKAPKMKSAKLTVYDDNGDKLFSESTSKMKVIKKVTKDKPAKKKTSSSKSSSSSGATYWASSKSNIFHYPGCEWAQKISGGNKIVFHSRSEALNSGFRPCQVCGP